MSDMPKCVLCGSDLELFGSYLVCRGVLKCPLHEWSMPRHAIDAIAAKLAPQPVGEKMIRARLAIRLNGATGQWSYDDGSPAIARTASDDICVAWLEAWVPLPQVPTVAAKVEGVKADE